MPRFSVIMPLYNKAPYVGRAVESVLNQTFEDWELIVVDDGSTDGGDAIVEKIKECRIQLFRQSNTGVSTARNNGVKHAKSEFLCFLDADDWWNPDFLDSMSELIIKYPEGGIYGTGYSIVKNGKSRPAPIGIEKSFEDGEINYCKVYANTLCMPLWTGAVCMPRSVYNEMNGFKPNLRLGEDFDLWIRVALKYPVFFLNRQLSNYNQDADASQRGTCRLHAPEYHMLWNLEYLEFEESRNKDYKALIDRLRVYNLKPYYLSTDYHDCTKEELKKVEWKNQPSRDRSFYSSPILLVRLHHKLLTVLFQLKNKML
jgi:glycosyltransferase involved in cell wall biosynthesis